MTETNRLNPVTDPQNVLRAVVPGVKAEDYKVEWFYFTNFVAFLLAKSINESLGSTLFDYGEIFSRKEGVKLEVQHLKFLGDVFTKDQLTKAADFLMKDVTENLYDSMNHGSVNLASLQNGAIESIAQNAVAYTVSIITECSKLWYTPKKDLEDMRKVGWGDYLVQSLSGIGCTRARSLAENIGNRDKSFQLWLYILIQYLSQSANRITALLYGEVRTANPAAPTANPAVSMQIPIQVPVTAAQQPQANDSVNLVGWQDLQPGIIPTDSNDQQTTGGNTYEELSPEERATVDSIVSGLQHLQDIQQNPHAFENEVNAANNILNQVTAGINQAVNNQSTEQHVCTCGHDNCNCGNH